MIKIAVCDNEDMMCEKLSSVIKNWFAKAEQLADIMKFRNGNELIRSKIHFDIIFLDIEMPILNGIETAKKLRIWDKTSKIIFMTNNNQYIGSAYKVHAFDYLSKPIQEKNIYSTLEDAIQYLDYIHTKDKYAFETEEGIVVAALST